MNLIDYIASFFPLTEADKAKLSAFDLNGSHIYVAAYVRWYWAYNEDTGEYESIRVTTQIQHEDLAIYDDRSPEYRDLIDRINLAEGRYIDKIDVNGLPEQGLYVGMCYITADLRGHLDDIFMFLPVKVEEITPAHVDM